MENKHESNQISQKDENEDGTNRKTSNGKDVAIIFFILSGVFLGIGFYKLLAYDNSTYDPVNVYVGGDAYNYIINSNLATAYFTVAILFTLIALGFLLIGTIKHKAMSGNNTVGNQ